MPIVRSGSETSVSGGSIAPLVQIEVPVEEIEAKPKPKGRGKADAEPVDA